ncbi:hypothetical protein HYQ46_003372 [Verticillium longisporum]|nr:hypothetical protein HYQ46_003372 [Verticillium longisporum]
MYSKMQEPSFMDPGTSQVSGQADARYRMKRSALRASLRSRRQAKASTSRPGRVGGSLTITELLPMTLR